MPSQSVEFSPLPHWEMYDKDDDTKNTHLWIVNRAIEMLAALTGPYRSAAIALRQFAGANVSSLHQGLWDADNKAPYNDPDSVGIAHYYSHFYDPDTGKNYAGDTSPTALTRGVEFFTRSLDLYAAGNFDAAAYNLGLSLHYLTDVGQPMHSFNFTNVDFPICYHQHFEDYTIQWTNATRPPPIPYDITERSDDPADYIKTAARLSKPRALTILSSRALWEYGWRTSFNPYPAGWRAIVDPELDGALKDIRRITAGYLLLWIIQAMGVSKTWSLRDVSSTADAPPAINDVLCGFAMSPPDNDPPAGTVDLLYLDGASHIHELTRQPGGQWSHSDLTGTLNIPTVADHVMVGFAGYNWPPRLAAYLDASGSVYELSQVPGSPWTCVNLTLATRAPPAGRPALAGFESLNPPRKQYGYLDAAGHLHILTATSGANWSHTDLTADLGAPPAFGATLIGFPWDIYTTIQFAYLDADGQIHEFNYMPYGGWSHNDLTKLLNAPPVIGVLLSGAGWNGGAAKFYAYVAADGHIHELATTWRGPWTHTDLFIAAEAPEVEVSALSCLTWEKGMSKLVAYTSSAGHVHELWFGPSGKWAYTDVTADVHKGRPVPHARGRALSAYAGELGFQQVAYVDGIGHVQLLTQGVWQLGFLPDDLALTRTVPSLEISRGRPAMNPCQWDISLARSGPSRCC